MKLNTQKRLAAQVLKCSSKRVIFDEDRLEDIKEAITKADIRALIIDKAISRKNKKGVSRVRVRKRDAQKRKGKQKGHGSRKGKKTARLPKKEAWMNKIRAQRAFLRVLKDNGMLDNKTFRELYLKAKGGFFRSKRHIKIYLEEHNLVKKVKKEEKPKKEETKKEPEKKAKFEKEEKTKKKIIKKEKKDGKKK